MTNSLHKAWFSPVLSTILANRTEGFVLMGVGGVQLGLHLLGLPGWACPFRAVFGVPCPGCGLTTALGELLHGRLLESLRTHAFAPIFLVVFFILLLSILLPDEQRRKLVNAMIILEGRTGITAWVLSGLMLYWGIRLFGLV